jgi:hypothetical protein
MGVHFWPTSKYANKIAVSQSLQSNRQFFDYQPLQSNPDIQLSTITQWPGHYLADPN